MIILMMFIFDEDIIINLKECLMEILFIIIIYLADYYD